MHTELYDIIQQSNNHTHNLHKDTDTNTLDSKEFLSSKVDYDNKSYSNSNFLKKNISVMNVITFLLCAGLLFHFKSFSTRIDSILKTTDSTLQLLLDVTKGRFVCEF